MRRSLLRTSLALLLIAPAANGYAATATTTFIVSATVLKVCTVTATNLGFGNYTPGSGAIAATSTVGVNCSNSTAYTVDLNVGSTSGGTFAQRLLANGANTLQYNLYTNNTHTTIWGDTTGGTSDQSGTGAGLGTVQNFTVYGNLPDSATNQGAVPGVYTDTITVTVAY